MRYRSNLAFYEENPIRGQRLGWIMISVGGLLMLFWGGKAVKKVIDIRRRNRVLNVLNKWKDKIRLYANKHGIYPSLLASVITQESDGRENAYRYEPAFYNRYIKGNSDWMGYKFYNQPQVISASYGLCQLMFTTAWRHATSEERNQMTADYRILYNVDFNMELGSRLIKYLWNKYGNRQDVLAAYNAGEGCVKKKCSKGYSYATSVIELENNIPSGIV